MAKDSRPGQIGIKEIALRAKVSIGTVDRVIHNRGSVSQKTRARIMEIIEELNYRPNLHAQRLASGKVIHIASLIPESSDETSFWAGPLKGIHQAVDEIGQFGIVVDQYFYNQDDIDSFESQSKLLLKSKPDGVLLAPSFVDESIKFTNKCLEAQIPYVLIDSDLPNQQSLTYIGPNLNQSGHLAAHLVKYLLPKQDRVLIVNISKEMDNQHHLLKKEEGFREYFRTLGLEEHILKIDINHTDLSSIENLLKAEFDKHKNIKVVFVTNSRVSSVASFLAKRRKKDKIILIGYDYLAENINYLQADVIDFLICQKPVEQAYRGITALYQHLAFATPIKKIQFMPINIITKENL